jgi:hypothetical protein
VDTAPGTLIIACGALAREIAALRRANGWTSVEICCLPPELHNRPERIAPAVREKIRAHRAGYRQLFVAYGDCYEFFAGPRAFAEMAEAEPGTFYLTDFLVRHFERLVVRGLGMDSHPELAQEYFRNYRKVIYLSQTPSASLIEQARQIAARLGLAFEHRHSGFGELGTRLMGVAAADRMPAWQR